MCPHDLWISQKKGHKASQSVLASPISKCAYHGHPGQMSGSSADIRHYAVKAINRQYQSGTDLHGQGWH